MFKSIREWVRRRRINKKTALTASRFKWLGLELIKVFPKNHDGTVRITAKVVGKPVEYIGKDFNFQGRKYIVKDMEYGKLCDSIVGLRCIDMGRNR